MENGKTLIRKVIFITCHDLFAQNQTGGQQCSNRNYRLLCNIYGEKNIKAAIITSRRGEWSENIAYFRAASSLLDLMIAAITKTNLYLYSEEKKIIQYIEDVDPSIIFMDSSLFGRIAQHFKKRRIVLFLHNIEYLYALNKVKNKGFWYIPQLLSFRYNEKLSIRFACRIIALNNRDNQDMFALYNKHADLLMPITFYDTFNEQKCQDIQTRITFDKKQLLFVGSYFMPNYKGILWFINEVLSQLRGFHLTIVGKGFENVRNELQCENVTVIGTVDNLAEYYYKFPVIVMPIFVGSGMKVKTAEAMMYGRTILATDEALEGYECNGINGIYRCNCREEFIDALEDIFNKDIPPFQKEVRKLFCDKYENNIPREKLKTLLNDLL